MAELHYKRAYEMRGIVAIPTDNLSQGTRKYNADEVEEVICAEG